MLVTTHKSFEEILKHAHGGIGRYTITNFKDGKLFAIETINGIGFKSYPVYEYSMVKTGGIFGFFKKTVVAEECIDVALSLSEAIGIFGVATKA